MSTTSGTQSYTTYSPTSNTNAGGAASTTNSGSTLNQADFLNLLTTQLQNQDPLDPESDTDMASQMAQFSSLTAMTNLNTTATQAAGYTEMQSAATMLGKTITSSATDSSGNAITGVVSSVGLSSSGTVTLDVDGNSVGLSTVTGIVQPSATS